MNLYLKVLEINQTRHKIYLNVKSKMRVIVPFHSHEIEVTCQNTNF